MHPSFFLPLIVSVGFHAMARVPSNDQDLAFTWERQIRPWVQDVAIEKAPLLVVRQMPEDGPQEDLLVFYEGKDGRVIFAWARSREITAQSLSNMYKHEMGMPLPPIPIELRVGTIAKNTVDALFLGAETFLKERPKSWEEMATTGHAGSLCVLKGSVVHVFEGPFDPKSEPVVARLARQLDSFRKSVRTINSFKVFEFPQTEKMIQWRFNRALLNGDEYLAIYLLSLGANPNKDPRFFESPLEQAIMRGKKALFDALIVHGADTTVTTSDGVSLVDYAKKYKAPWALSILESRAKR